MISSFDRNSNEVAESGFLRDFAADVWAEFPLSEALEPGRLPLLAGLVMSSKEPREMTFRRCGRLLAMMVHSATSNHFIPEQSGVTENTANVKWNFLIFFQMQTTEISMV